MKHFDVIIIGAGAAGLMCAIEAGKRDRDVLLIDKAEKIGKKILISGGGRCNFTNMYTSPDDFLSENEHFCKSALSRYTPWDFIASLESHGLSWTEKTLGQLFCDQKSAAVVKMLVDECKSVGVDFELACDVNTIEKQSDATKSNHHSFHIETSNGNYQCDSLVIATGGPSIPRMGSTDFALQIAKQFSIKNYSFSPALVPFTFSQVDLDQLIKGLSGVSTFVELCVLNNKKNKKIQKQNMCFKESILFTHRGISGPAALQISSYWNKGDALVVNLFPDEDVLEWLKSLQQELPNTELKTVLNYKLPKRLVLVMIEHFLDNKNKVLKQYSESELDQVAHQLTNWQLIPSGTEGMRTAEVSLGGIDTDELSSKTFETKTETGLYFIGESIDVTGHLGGFNFQWAWASGWCAGQFV